MRIQSQHACFLAREMHTRTHGRATYARLAEGGREVGEHARRPAARDVVCSSAPRRGCGGAREGAEPAWVRSLVKKPAKQRTRNIHVELVVLLVVLDAVCASATTVSFSGKIHGEKIHSRSAHFAGSQHMACSPVHGGEARPYLM